LVDLVAEKDKSAVEEALGELTIFEGQVPQSRSIKVRCAAPPFAVSRLEPPTKLRGRGCAS